MIIFLYGADTYRSRQKLNELKAKFVREVDPDGSSLLTIEGENAGMEEINKAIASPSLFARRRMIVVEDIFSNKNKALAEELAGYLKDRFSSDDQDNILVFLDPTDGAKMSKNPLFAFLSSLKLAQNFKSLSNTEASAWIKRQAKERNVNIKQQAAFRLTSLFGGDLWQLTNEVNKLANYKKGLNPELVGGGGAVIEAEDVDLHCRGKIDENIFAFTDALSHRNKALALEFLEKELTAGVAEPYLLFMVLRQIKILIQVRDALDEGLSSRQIINQLKLHPFVAQKSITQAGKFKLNSLKLIFDKLLALDQKLKTGQAELKSSFAMLIMSL